MYQVTGALRHGDIEDNITREVGRRTGKESRCVVLGHLQRGGSPNAFDRMLGTNFGACAVRALASGETGKMVGLQADRKSTRLNSSHLVISYAVFCLKKKRKYLKTLHITNR